MCLVAEERGDEQPVARWQVAQCHFVETVEGPQRNDIPATSRGRNSRFAIKLIDPLLTHSRNDLLITSKTYSRNDLLITSKTNQAGVEAEIPTR